MHHNHPGYLRNRACTAPAVTPTAFPIDRVDTAGSSSSARARRHHTSIDTSSPNHAASPAVKARPALTGQASPVANENGETTFKRSRELDRRWGSDLVEKVIAFGMTAISERAKEQGGFLAYDPFEDMGLAAWMRPIIREHLEQFTS